MLYYVKDKDFLSIDLKREEILYLI